MMGGPQRMLAGQSGLAVRQLPSCSQTDSLPAAGVFSARDKLRLLLAPLFLSGSWVAGTVWRIIICGIYKGAGALH